MKYGIELTNDCNLRCEMCPRNYIDMEIGYMSDETWEETLSKIPMVSTIFPFWRGESTLHPRFGKLMEDLIEYENVVIGTNGTNPDLIIDVLPILKVVNVSIHGQSSYEGYLKIKEHANGTKIIASMVEGEREFLLPDRVYKRHTLGGLWGKVDGMNGFPSVPCIWKDEIVTTWDGRNPKCRYVWEIPAPQNVCSDCSEWAGDGRAL